MVLQKGVLPTGIKDQIKSALKIVGQEVFKLSQQYVPVKSGQLKASGNLTTGLSGGGFAIEYTAPYAQRIESGGPVQDIKGRYVSDIPKHQRRLPGKTITVRAHTKTYRNMKPVKTDGGWYTLGQVPAFTGTHFLERAFKEVFTQQKLWKHFPFEKI